MPFTNMGLGGTLNFDASQALIALGNTTASFRDLKGSMGGVSAVAAKLNTAFSSLKYAALPINNAMMSAATSAATFEQQMSKVKSKTQANYQEMAMLSAEAKRLGVITQFTGIQAGEAMEFMGQAGAEPLQIMQAIPGVLAAAAAEGIDLGTTAQIVMGTINGMGMSFKDATHIANGMALASAKTAATIQGIGSAMTYVGSNAHALGVSFDEVTSSLGLLANANLSGTIGGTSLNAMLRGLMGGSARARKELSNLHIKITDAKTGGFLPLADIIDQLNGKLAKYTDVTQRGQMVQRLFGTEGMKAYNALASAGGDKLRDLTDAVRRNTTAAEEMAATLLDNLLGKLKLFKSSVEVFGTELFEPLLKPLRGFVEGGTDQLNDVIAVMMRLRKVSAFVGPPTAGMMAGPGAGFMGPTDPNAVAEAPKTMWTTLKEQYGDTTYSIAEGIVNAVDDVKITLKYFRTLIGDVRARLKAIFPDDVVEKISHFTAKFAFWTLALTPLLVGLGAVGFVLKSILWPVLSAVGDVLGGIIPMFSGIGSGILKAFGMIRAVLSGILPALGEFLYFLASPGTLAATWEIVVAAISPFLPLIIGIVAVVGILGAAFAMYRKDGESFGDTLVRLWGDVSAAAMDFWENTLKPLWDGISDGFMSTWGGIQEQFTGVIDELKAAWNSIVAIWSSGTQSTSKDWWNFGYAIGNAVGKLIQGGLWLLKWTVWLFSGVARVGALLVKMIVDPIIWAMKEAGKLLELLFGADKKAQEMADKKWGQKPSQIAAPTPVEPIGVLNPNAPMRFQTPWLLQKAAENKAAQPEIKLPDVNLNLKTEHTTVTKSIIDGKEVANTVTKHQTEISERAGWRATPWFRQVTTEHGAMPVMA